MNRKQYDKFVKSVKEIMAYAGYEENKDNSYRYVVNTAYGKLNISIHDYERGDKLYYIFTRFDDVEKAKTRFVDGGYSLYGFNRNSGKCNIHSMVEENTLWDFKELLEAACEKEFDNFEMAI